MKKSDLEKQITAIESERGNPAHTYSAETATNEQVKLNKLYISSLLKNEFNESTNRNNVWLIGLTIMIAVLTLIMLVKMFIG